MTTPATPSHDQPPAAQPGEKLTRQAVTAVTIAIVAMTFAFSLGNVTQLCLHLGITAWLAWLVAPTVDLSVIGLLTGIRYLSLHGYTTADLAGLRRLLRFCGLLTLALNTAGSIAARQYGTALVDTVGPALLIGWSEVGPWMLHQIHAIRLITDAAGNEPQEVHAASQTVSEVGQPVVLPPVLLARTRELDAKHREATGRPISRDNLRAQLRISRDRASALVAVVRAEIAAGNPGVLPQAALSGRPTVGKA